MVSGDNLKIIFVVAVVGLFILQYAGMGLNAPSEEQGVPADYYQGVAVINASIDYYDRLLYVSELSYDEMEIVKGMEGVKDVTNKGGKYEISLERKEDVYPVYKELKEMEIDSYGTAKITLQSEVAMKDQYQNDITGYFYNRKVKIENLEPVFPEASVIEVRTQVLIQEEQAYQTGNIQLYTELREIEADALVLSKKHYFEYNVPWGQRNEVDLEGLQEEYGEENVEYEKNNQIVFSVPLSVNDQVNKKFDYVEYISANLAIINENYSDADEIKNQFGENTILMNSTLLINSEESNLDFEYYDYHLYEVELNLGEKYILNEELSVQNLKYEGELEQGSEIKLNMSTYITGNNILSIEEVSILE